MEKQEIHENNNRDAVFAGKYYPAGKEELKKEMKELFSRAKPSQNITRHPRAIISPHAGYMFSGQIAASAFNQIIKKENYKRVFIIASSHNSVFNGASILLNENYSTPLGILNTDVEIAEKLISEEKLFLNYPEAHDNEHSIEVQLPFIQYVMNENITIVPILLGNVSERQCEKLAKSLFPYFTPDNLFVVSTDFCHYPEYKVAKDRDMVTAEAICSNNPETLMQIIKDDEKRHIHNLVTSLCGWTSVLTLLYLTKRGNVEYQMIDYKNSGDFEFYGDKSRVVGYWAISVVGDTDFEFSVTDDEKKELLLKARNSIVKYVKNGRLGDLSLPVSTGILTQQTGVFVSIYVDKELRGCVGNFAQDDILNNLVQRMAVSAACDPRFDSIRKEELEKMELEISVLSPLKRIKSIKDFELGRHGIYIKKDFYSGTFLPQVANKTGWTKEEFLGHCSRDKAGIGWNGWKNAELYKYEAIIFKG